MKRYEITFQKLAQKKEGAFVPFVVLGDPDPALSLQIIQTLIDAGADALELGLAFSDPVADGAVIQRADLRVLQKGVKTSEALGIIKKIRERNSDIPIGILTYANLVVHHDAEAFYASLKSVGVDSLLIADLPTLEAEPFVAVAKKHDIAQVMIVPPNIDDERLQYIARVSSGYVYVVTRRGVTGSDEKLSLSSQNVFAKLRAYDAPPALYGFGISTPAHVKEACEAGAAGAISGSAVVALIEEQREKPDHLLQKLSIFVRAMKESSKGFLPSEL